MCVCECVVWVLTPDPNLSLTPRFAKCSPTLSPPGCCRTPWLQWVRVCMCVCDEVLSNRWSNLIHVSFLPRCPLALMVCWWCYLGLTSILSALFLEAADPALTCSASLPPGAQTHTDPTREGTSGGADLGLPGRSEWSTSGKQHIVYCPFCFSPWQAH